MVFNVPVLMTRFERFGFEDIPVGLLIVSVYVFVLVPLGAVTTILMLLLPMLSGISPDVEPLATVTLFTLIVAEASAAVGVIVIEFVVLGTVAV